MVKKVTAKEKIRRFHKLKQIELMNQAKEEQGITGWRLPEYDDAKQLTKMLNKYFDLKDEGWKPYTPTGFARALWLTKDQVLNYEWPELLKKIITEWLQRIEEHLEERLVLSKNPTGIKFQLSNDFGWTNKTENTTNINAVIWVQKVFDEIIKKPETLADFQQVPNLEHTESLIYNEQEETDEGSQ